MEASRRASEAFVQEHLANHLRLNPGATYKSWIADFIPENVSLDPRLENEGSACLKIWRGISSRSRARAAAAQLEEDDNDREAAADMETSRRASEAHVREHLANHLRRNPGATYKSWIADVVPEDISLDPRLENKGSALLEIWRTLSSRSSAQADELPGREGAGKPPGQLQPVPGPLELRDGLMPTRCL